MSKQNLSEEEFKETLKHLILGFSPSCDMNALSDEDIDKTSRYVGEALETGSKIKPVVRMLIREDEKYEKPISRIVHKLMSVTNHVWLCEYCVYVLKWRLKKENSLTLPVIKGCLMKKHPDLIGLKKIAGSVHSILAYEKEVLKGIIDTEETKLKSLKGVKKKEKDNLKSLFLKKRGDLRRSLLQRGRKNAECMLRGYEMSVLKEPSKTGKIPTCQRDVANALVEEGLTDKCSQQTVSRWNAVVEEELQALSG